ncbi:MAG TPA: hypothetical protein VFB78_13620 [Acidimicrobiales bacterium]|nr:hypothetical protein [Acidimicrobiales bacterium]
MITGATPTVWMSAPRPVVPGPAEVGPATADRSNNNLDVIEHDGRRYLAWRTAPHHFAHRDARLHVVSSADNGASWRYETTIALGRDVREPRFLEVAGELFLYFFTLGRVWYRFEPDRVHAIKRDASGWSSPRPISEPGVVEWRPRYLHGVPTMCVYKGADTTYSGSPEPTRVEVWTTDDGWSWRPLDADQPTSHVGGTETDLVEAPHGGWVGVTRLEGPEGWGTDVIHSPGGRPDDWVTRRYPNKLDSPLVFRVGDDVFVVARRQVAFGGRYDLGWRRPSPVLRTTLYHLAYWVTRKRSALWHIDVTTSELLHVADLPGQGDTCFPGLVTNAAGDVTIYNYTSPLDGPDRPWLLGQLGRTAIYTVDLRVTAS